MVAIQDDITSDQFPGLVWQLAKQTSKNSTFPSPRSSHTLTIVGTNAFLFGGLCQVPQVSTHHFSHSILDESDDDIQASNEVFKLNLSNKNEVEWSKINCDMNSSAILGEKGKNQLASPLPRWKHSATLIENTQILIFGGFHTTDHRLNDLWIFDTLSYTWSQPNPSHNYEASQPNQLINSEWQSVPTPRGGHSANLVGNCVYFFGGYGGIGYSRRDLDELYSLNIFTWTWNKVTAKGISPDKRSGHSSVAIEKKIYIIGGYNSSQQFDDFYILDLENENNIHWTKVNINLPSPYWNMSVCNVLAIPSNKIFLFGGLSGVLSDQDRLGKVQNEVLIFDTGIEKWQFPKIYGKHGSALDSEKVEIPSARSECSLIYDTKGSRLIVFGGWNDGWYNDIHLLDIGNIVGPPYAILDIVPSIGPITGGTEVVIMGIDFTPSNNILVRFGSHKNFVDVNGTYVSQNKITCVTPASKFNTNEVNVRVAFNNDSFTTTYQKFNYFPITSIKNTIIFGPGLLNGCVINEEVSFIIQAKDDEGNNRTTGGDEFSVIIMMLNEGENGENVRIPGVMINDLQNGRYIVTYKVKYPGLYSVSIDFLGTYGAKAGELRGSGVVIEFLSKAPRENNQLTGELVLNALKSDLTQLQKFVDEVGKSLLVRLKDGSSGDGMMFGSGSTDDQVAFLMKIKENLVLVENKTEEINLMVERSECIIQYLLEQNMIVGNLEEQLYNSKYLWEKILKEAPIIQNKITPMMRSHHSKIKQDISNYEQHIIAFKTSLSSCSFYTYAVGTELALRMISDVEEKLKLENIVYEKLLKVAVIFECSKEMENITKCIGEIGVSLSELRQLWEVQSKITSQIEEIKFYDWKTLDTEALEDTSKSFQSLLRKLPRTIRSSDAFIGLEKIVKEFVILCPVLTSLHSPSMRDRHWDELMTLLQTTFVTPSLQPDMTLQPLFELELFKYAADIEEITDKAVKENKHEETLKFLESTWKEAIFSMQFYKDTDVPLLKLEDEIVEQLEADQMAVQSIVGSRYAFFKPPAAEWQRVLGVISDVYQLLNDIQKTWSYLEPLFIGSEEVKRELPDDARRFQEVDAQIKNILQKSWKLRNVRTVCTQPNMINTLQQLEEEQSKCKKSLSDFLDGKRRQFPRFYFMSESDLLTLLSNSSSPHKVLVLIDKILLSTSSITLEDNPISKDRPIASRFIAGVGIEEVIFEPPVQIFGKAEMYLQSLLDAQIFTLSRTLASSIARYPEQARSKWVIAKDNKTGKILDPAQIILLVSGIDFTTQVEKAMIQCAKGEAKAMIKCQELIKVQLSDLINLTQGKLTKEERQRVMCMITLDAHNRDIVDTLIQEKALNINDFQWQSKLRPYFKGQLPKDVTNVASMSIFKICDASFEYGFEYLGNGPRLVVTPLTDRIYVTATQALHLKMGCAPAGPAGTGKTETTKDLASALGKCCYVFNCSPEMDYQSMGNIFKGLSASGSWGCFDEFNRLIPEVLSVCSVQFKSVCDSLRSYSKNDINTHRVTIEGDTVNLDPTLGVFITMNPGYLGRSELPEGLKSLFRPITVVVPDLVLICENMMMAEGFLTAKLLASKFFSLYSLLAQLLSKQAHYDWGLRAVKSVLVVAGHLKRAEPNLAEDALLMRALRDFNIPKIVQQDEVIFFGLLNDLFPGLNPPRVFDETLSECISIASENSGLYPDPFFTLKAMQLDELIAIRHCVFIMGPPGAGKTSAWKTLQLALNYQYTSKHSDVRVKVVDLNPKVVPTEELYGHISLSTREWKDGLLSCLMRDLGRIPNDHPKWLVLDGDLDANWIESMNSVMDDNKMLTLASNERIPLKSYMRMIFEIRDLKYATPATVSRAGILYISTDEGSQWRSIVGSWVRSRPQELFSPTDKEVIHALFEKYLPSCLKFFATEVSGIVQYNDITLSISMLRLLDIILTPTLVADPTSLEISFVFCLIWGLGSVLTLGDDGTDNRKNFSDFFRAKFNKSVKIPTRDTIFDYWFDTKNVKFESWKVSPAFKSIEFNSLTMKMTNITVPTAETASISFWLEKLVLGGYNVMLAGPAGTGKTKLIQGLLSSLNPESHISTTVNMNFYTSAHVLLNTLESVLQKRTGTNYGPPGSAKMVYFIDDLNLPEVDPYGTQSAIALLRQHIDYGHWYDPVKLTIKSIDDCQYISALNPTAGSFLINPRLQRHFSCFAVGMPTATSLLTIFQTFLDGHLLNQPFNSAVQALSSTLIKSALAVHKEVSETFRKTAANFHYEFNIRHLANVFDGLLVATPQTIREPEKLVYLWLHESERVYGDRLVDTEDIDKLKSILQNQAKKFFPQYNVVRFYLSGGGVKADPLVFCHFAEGAQVSGDDLAYEQALSMVDLKNTLEHSLNEYNELNAVMNLVLFDDAVLHVARIIRIVKQVGGHALLVGVGGSGKQSLSRLAAYVCGLSVFQIMANHTYSINDFKADLQSMYNKAGVKQEGVLFLLTDTQIINERFLVYLNDLLSSGNIPDLYTKDEKDTLISSITNKAKGAGYSTDPASVWKYFINKIRENLHVCMCFSPVGPSLRVRARRFPALASCTVIDWFQPWPEQALASVGKRFLSNLELGSPEIRQSIEQFMPASFVAVNKMCKTYLQSEGKYVYTTPKSYLEMLSLYNALLENHRLNTDKNITRLQHGIEKLEKAASDVVELEANLKVMLISAEEKRQVAEEIAENVNHEKSIVEQENANAQIEKEKVAAIQAEVSAKQVDASNDLALAEPALMGAMAALDSLDKKDLGNCKTMAKPPPGVEDIFGAVMVLLAGINQNIIVQKSGRVREKERTWEASKKALLGNVNGFLEELKNFKNFIDNGTVPEINWKEVRPFLSLEHFSPEIIEKRNSAAAGLCSWVINIVKYYDIVLQVEPKRQALKQANDQLEAANIQLNEVVERVNKLEAKLAQLTIEYNEAEASRKEAQETAEKGKLKLELANRLTAALGSEKVRWGEGIIALQSERDLLVGDCLLASSFISYVGPFTKFYRETLMNDIFVPLVQSPSNGTPIPMTADIEPFGIVCSEADIAEYQTQGLPSDKSSAENAAIVLNSARYPLLVDPQLQAINWIKRREGADLKVGRLGEKNLTVNILKAIEEGVPFLIENMGEHIDPTLLPIIARVSIKRGSKRFIHIGDSEVEISPKFRLYLHTKLSNPHYPPEIQAETTLVNFTVTQDGLEEQLLSLVVKYERSDLAAQRSAVILQQNLITIKVKQLEDQILQRLADAQGDITENRELIEELELSKRISQEINVKFTQGQDLSRRLQATSEQYRPVARRGALLYASVLASLRKIHMYYIYSLSSFIMCFLRGIVIVNGGVFEESLKILHNDNNFDDESIIYDEDGNQIGSSNSSQVDDIDLDELGQQIADREFEIAERDKQVGDLDLGSHLNKLKDKITQVVFDFVKSGLFEKDKITVLTLLTFRILVDEGIMPNEMVNLIVRGRMAEDVTPRGPELSSWLSEAAWARIKALEEDSQGNLTDLGEKFAADAEDWEEWAARPDPENFPMPGEYANLDSLTRLALLRVLRPDRIQSALLTFAKAHLGEAFLSLSPPSLANVFHFTNNATPCLFILYPGVDPTPWVEELGIEKGITYDNNLLCNVSLGQGQEKRAEESLKKLAEVGGWLFLQNVHLMQSWLPRLVTLLETLTPHPNFRLFLSAEPPGIGGDGALPEALVQSALALTNEPSSDLRANITKAWSIITAQPHITYPANLAGENYGLSSGVQFANALRSTVSSLCYFHGVVLGRRRFGTQGWTRPYGFSNGDLKISADIILSYLGRASDSLVKEKKSKTLASLVPWQDLRYIIGEIMYGGHITDYFDRRTALTYLELFFKPQTLNRLIFVPHFSFNDKGFIPDNYDKQTLNRFGWLGVDPNVLSTNALHESSLESNIINNTTHVALPQSLPLDDLPRESPVLYGLPANVEVRSLAKSGEDLCETLRRVEMGSDTTSSQGNSSLVKDVLNDLLKRCPEPFELITLSENAKPHIETEYGPFVLVLLQECSRMTTLLNFIRSSLEELLKGLNGQLNMTQNMEDLSLYLSLNKVPGQILGLSCDWMSLAWPSNKSLTQWFNDLILRYNQFNVWKSEFILPQPIWLPGLINPLALLTAIKQVTARKDGIPLDTMTLMTHVTLYNATKKYTHLSQPHDGLLVNGLFIEGASWIGEDETESHYVLNNIHCGGYLGEAKLKQLLNPLPIVYIQALTVEKDWVPGPGGGYLRNDPTLYECPCYVTSSRGPTFAFLSYLKTPSNIPTHRWILAGTALLMQSDD